MHTDIIIVGAGLVGTPLSLTLSRLGFKVTLIDRGSVTSPQSSNPLRQQCTALSLNTQLWLAKHDLWESIAADATSINEVHVSQRGYFGASRLRATELDVEALGFVVNNTEMLACLHEQLVSSDVEHLTNAEVKRIVASDSANADSVQVHCKQGEQSLELSARLLIATDGVTSTVRESLGIAQQHTDYAQVGILGSVELVDAHQHTAYERFTDSGPLAMLPRGSHHMSFVECIDEDDRATMEALDDAAFCEHLQQRFGTRLGVIKSIGPRYLTPLVRIEAKQQIAERTLLLGNSARLLHPIAGQGYNLAIRDVAGLLALLDPVSRDAASSLDPGSNTLLKSFVSTRQSDQQAVVRMTDLFARSFRGSASIPSHVRSLGLMGLDAFTPLRHHFARRSMGLG